MTLPEGYRTVWHLIASDVLSGNNVGAVEVAFDADRFDVSAEPLSADD
jgi:hypothetical protein